MTADNPARQPWWRKWFGNRSERAAEKYLRGLGYRILARNYTCKLGELDLVACEGQTVVFVEVRSTGGDDPLRAALSVNRTKQRKLTRLAVYFLKQKKMLEHYARFDVLTVHWPGDEKEPVIEHYKNAFEAADI